MIDVIPDSDKPWGIYDALLDKSKVKIVVECDNVIFASNKFPIMDGNFISFKGASIYKVSGKNLTDRDFPIKANTIHVRPGELNLKGIYKNVGITTEE